MTEAFPTFYRRHADPEYARLFEVASVNGGIPDPEVVVSTSLYWGARIAGSKVPPLSWEAMTSFFITGKKNSRGSWWNNYMGPLIAGCHQKLPDKWEHRIYLSANLAILKDMFPSHVRVVVMQESSAGTMPGMLWRYLPLMEPVLCVARGADNFTLPGGYLKLLKESLVQKASLVRMAFTYNFPEHENKFPYRPVSGSCAARGPLPFLESATHWLKTNRESPEQLVREYRGMKHSAMQRWDSFGQDEQFLSRWLYHLMAQPGNLIFTEPRPDPYQPSEYYKMDCRFLADLGVRHYTLPTL